MASSKLISSSPKHPRLPPKVVEIQTKIKEKEKQRLKVLGGTGLPEDRANLIGPITEEIKHLRQEKIRAFMEANNRLNKRIRRTIKERIQEPSGS